MGGPHGKMHAGSPFMGHQVRTEPFVKGAVRAFDHEMIIHVPQHGCVGIRFGQLPLRGGICGSQAVGEAG